MDQLFNPYNKEQEVDPGLDIMAHHGGRKMYLAELSAYMKKMEPIEESLSTINQRMLILYHHQNIDDGIARIVNLRKDESISKSWKIDSLFNWPKIKRQLTDSPDTKIDFTKMVMVLRNGAIEYMHKRCPISFSSIESIENGHTSSMVNKDYGIITLDNKTRTLYISIVNRDTDRICCFLDDLVPECKPGYFREPRLSTEEGFAVEKQQYNASFQIADPFVDNKSSRLVHLEKGETITKSIHYKYLAFRNQIESKALKDNTANYIIWFPIRYKKGDSIMIDFATYKIN